MIGPAKIVVRYASGKMLKGYSQDFSPTSLNFHVRRNEGAGSEPGQLVSLRDLKAVFFVRDFSGNSTYDEQKMFMAGKALSGKKIEVTFNDGEVLVGTTMGYDAQRLGFFLFPADDQANNTRMFVVMAAVKTVRFL
ncbi:MAG: hypothetical protein FJ247_01510 [Nitrospira sp.]|nr:hypothetical protein [Nitrospira sp.]